MVFIFQELCVTHMSNPCFSLLETCAKATRHRNKGPPQLPRYPLSIPREPCGVTQHLRLSLPAPSFLSRFTEPQASESTV